MKTLLNEYINIVMYTICGVLLVLSSYNILINYNHAVYLNQKVVVSDNDNNYRVYKENVLKIESKLSKIKKGSNEYNALQNTLNLMKKDGAYYLLPGSKLGYYELYNLNNYFIDTIINNGWVSSLKQVNSFNTTINNSLINVLINSSDYINKELLNNSNYHYDVKNNEIRKTIDEEYNAIISNYRNFSNLVIELYNDVGGQNA